MKSFCIFLCVCFVFACLAFFAPKKPTDIFKGWVEVYYGYSLETNFESQKLGEGTLVFCHSDQLDLLPQDYFAISLTVSAECWERVQSFFDFRQIKTESGEDFDSALVFCPSLLGGVVIGGQRVSAQVAEVNGEIKIGFPMIVGAF